MELDFAQDYILENERVKLVPLNENHVGFLKSLAQEKALWTYFLGRSNGLENFESYIIDAIDHRRKEKEYPFAIVDKSTGSFAGCTRFFEYSQSLKGIRLGHTWYGTKFRGTGPNKNCKFLLFEFAFEQLDLERIGLGAHEENLISIKAMESVGCIREGSIRNLFPSIHKIGRSNAILFSILKEEWILTVRQDLKKKL